MRKKPARPCPYCGKEQAKLKRHMFLVHYDKREVQAIKKMSMNEQAEAVKQLRRKGMTEANKKLVADKDAVLHCEKRGKSERKIANSVMCSECNTVLSRSFFHRHRQTCKRTAPSATPILATPMTVLNSSIDALSTDVLDRFERDEVGEICRTDSVCLLIGKNAYQKACARGPKKTSGRKSTMRDMRCLSSLFIHIRNAASENNSTLQNVEAIFDRKNFEYLEIGITRMCAKEDGESKYGVKLQVGNLLRNVCSVLKGTYLCTPGNEEKAIEIERFLAVLKLKWSQIFGDAEYQAAMRRQNHLRKPTQLPDEDSLAKLREYTIVQLARLTADGYVFISKSDFVFLRSLAVSRLTLFNARRGGEPARLTLQQWEEAKTGVWLSDSVKPHLDYIEKNIIKRLKICYQSGKGVGRMVPVTIPQDVEPALHLLADQELRKQVTVHPKNMFLFPMENYSEDHASGWHSIDLVCKKAGIKCRITATGVRHRTSTIYAALELPEQDRRYFYQHMGHSEEINKNVYQCPAALAEVTKIGSFLEWLDNGQTTRGTKNIIQLLS